jgi:hypothetical protein
MIGWVRRSKFYRPIIASLFEKLGTPVCNKILLSEKALEKTDFVLLRFYEEFRKVYNRIPKNKTDGDIRRLAKAVWELPDDRYITQNELIAKTRLGNSVKDTLDLIDRCAIYGYIRSGKKTEGKNKVTVYGRGKISPP